MRCLSSTDETNHENNKIRTRSVQQQCSETKWVGKLS